MAESTDRAAIYIDGNNWYHFMQAAGVRNTFELSYSKISQKLIGPREWKFTRYYIGAVNQSRSATDYKNQRAFLSNIQKEDPRITAHLGRLELRYQENPLVKPLLDKISDSTLEISIESQLEIARFVQPFARVETQKEKAVDVMLARDFLVGAMQHEYDSAYLLSADGDLTPVVESARALGKKVYCASPGFSSELNKVANTFIKLTGVWFADCYR